MGSVKIPPSMVDKPSARKHLASPLRPIGFPTISPIATQSPVVSTITTKHNDNHGDDGAHIKGRITEGEWCNKCHPIRLTYFAEIGYAHDGGNNSAANEPDQHGDVTQKAFTITIYDNNNG